MEIKPKAPFTCKPDAHVWPCREQGGILMNDERLPGKTCQCGEMIIVYKRCVCGIYVHPAVKINSQDAKEWFGGIENIEETNDGD